MLPAPKGTHTDTGTQTGGSARRSRGTDEGGTRDPAAPQRPTGRPGSPLRGDIMTQVKSSQTTGRLAQMDMQGRCSRGQRVSAWRALKEQFEELTLIPCAMHAMKECSDTLRQSCVNWHC